MHCSICKTGTTRKGTKSILLERNDHFVVIKGVEGEVCSNCGELYMNAETTKETLRKANELMNSGAALQLAQWKAA